MTSPQPLRILVVENDPHQRIDLIETLRAWPYEYFVAEPSALAQDPSSGLLEDARRKARQHRCHLALVDLRLRDDADPHDMSGLALVADLAPTLSIILSSHLNRQIVNTELSQMAEPPQRVCEFVGKEDGPEALWGAIRRAERERWCRREVTFLRPKELEPSAVIRRFVRKGEPAPSDQVDDVLRRLFPRATRLKVESLTETLSPTNLLFRQRSWIFKVFEDDHLRPFIVKLARAGRIDNEWQRFNKVKPFFPSARYAQLYGKPVELWDVGGTIYEFIGDHQDFPVATFSEYCQMHGSQEIGVALANFRSFWRRLYQRQPYRAVRRFCRPAMQSGGRSGASGCSIPSRCRIGRILHKVWGWASCRTRLPG